MTGGHPGGSGRKRRAAIVLGALVVALLAGSWLLWLVVEAALGEVSLEALEAWVEAAGPWAPAASVALMVVHTVVPFPAELLAAANGMAFGAVPGSLVTWLGGLAGAATGYAVGSLLERWVVRRGEDAEGLARMRHLVERHGTLGLVAVRLLPVIPFNVVDYAAGVLRLSWWTFAWTTAVGILPWSVLLTVSGAHVAHALRGDALALAVLVGTAVLLAAAVWAGHRWSRGGPRRAPSGTGDAIRGGTPGETARLVVPDMACGACADRLSRRLRDEPGVRDVGVELEGRVIQIDFDGGRTSVGRLAGAVRDEGFRAETAAAQASRGR